MYELELIYDSLIGEKHLENQDDILIINTELYNLYFLFDGVSLSKNPKKGIEIAKDFVKNNYSNYFVNSEFSFSSLMFDVNKVILESELDEPYTTYAAIFISLKGQEIKISNLGDSRIYGISNQYISQYSHDDVNPYQSNIITKCLGMSGLSKVDFSESKISSQEEKLLLCSDGFYNLMEINKARYHEIFNFNRLLYIKTALSKEIKNKNEDDATYILISKTN